MPRKSGFARHRARRRRKTYGDRGGKPTTVFRIEVVAQLPDVRERMRLAQRLAGLDDADLAKRIGMSPQAFCKMWRRKRIGEHILRDIEAALGVTREYWTTPIEVPERVCPTAFMSAVADDARCA